MGLAEFCLVIIICGFILGLNPSFVTTIINLLMAAVGRKSARYTLAGAATLYIEVILVIYFAVAALAAWIFNIISYDVLDDWGLFLGVLLVCFGLLEITFAYVSSMEQKKRYLSPRAHKHTAKSSKISSVVLLSAITTIKTYRLGILPVIASSYIFVYIGNATLSYLALMPISLIFPSLIVALLSMNKIKLSAILKWKIDNAIAFQTWSGVTIVCLGWIIWLIVGESL